jgi:glycerate 2-kinase
MNMPNLTQLRLAAREIFDETLQAVNAYDAVRRSIRLEGPRLNVCDEVFDLENRQVHSISIGKAAFAMASALNETLGARLGASIITTGAATYEVARRDAGGPQAGMPALRHRWQVFQGGHPEPNEQSLAAARAAFNLLKRANEERALVVFLISGGGSAMIEWPINNAISLEDLHTANQTLVNCGASISEINAIRRAFSAVKGGRLAARAPDCDQITLIVSDVTSGEEWNVASGPTLAPPAEAPNALEVIARYDLRSHLPDTILRAIEAGKEPSASKSASVRQRFVLLDNHSALEAAVAAARRRGFATEIAADISDQPITEGCSRLLDNLDSLQERSKIQRSSQPTTVCLISGGEFACPVKGEGIGGRDLETALRLAVAESSSSRDSSLFVAICAGTDGIDGNSPAAGAIVDNTTIQRARAIGLDPLDFINRSDAYSFFVAMGDAIATGATGTNVRDVRILLASDE